MAVGLSILDFGLEEKKNVLTTDKHSAAKPQ